MNKKEDELMNHADFLGTLGMIDLISEKHKQLRHITMAKIAESVDDKFSEMEIYLLILNQHTPMSLSESARYMNISRQAVHKHAKYLSTLGYIEVTSSDSNRRDKVVELTQAGKLLGEQINAIKTELELELEKELGSENYRKIIGLFRSEWSLDPENS